MTRIRRFLALYQASTRRSFVVALALSIALSLLDFLALVLLFPVLGVLVGGGTQTAGGGPLKLIGLSLQPQMMLVFALSLLILRTVAGFLYKYWWARRVASAEVYLSNRLLSAYAFAPYNYHLSRSSSDLLSRSVSHVNIASNSGLNGLALVAADATTVIGLAAALFIASPEAAVIVCGYLAILSGLFAFLSRRIVSKQATRFSQHVGQVYGRASTMLRGIRDLTVAGGREVALGSIRESRVEMVKTQRHMAVLTDLPRVILECALYSAALVGLMVVLNQPNAELNLAVVALYIVAGLRILPVIARGLGNATQARTGIELGHQVGGELQSVVGQDDPATGRQSSPPRHGSLEVRDVSFTYDDRKAVLKDVDLRVDFGDFVALVGPSGSGKSTLLSILLGLLRPTRGSVAFGGVEIGLANPNWFRHIAYVPQDTFVTDESVLSNIALGFPRPNEAEAWSALDRAALGDVIRDMPDGLNTRLGENGSRLSIGQRQRLGLARALYRSPSVLVLDEPTAALDVSTEREVMDAILSLKGTLTIVLVTHRLATTRDADSIVRLDRGRLTPVLDQLQLMVDAAGSEI